MKDIIDQYFSESEQKTLLAFQQDLHANPELSLEEERTGQKCFEALSQCNPIEIHRVAKTGVIARLKGKNKDAPLIAIRGDIDALPIQEKTDLDYASKIGGKMHACGHDVHATWALGAAQLLTKNPAEGDILILCQPAEEISKGALTVLEENVLKNVKAIYGGHVDRNYEVGQVVTQQGPIAASSDRFYITLKGKSAHGARPHEGLDPIPALGAIISGLHTIISRSVNPAETGVITIGEVNAGTATNILPETAQLNGIIRAIDPKVRERLHEKVISMAKNSAKAYGVEVDCKLHVGQPPIINQTPHISWAKEVVEDILSKENSIDLKETNMGGEDFAYYLEKIPGCFIRFGARYAHEEPIPAHSSEFYVAPETNFIGAIILSELARKASKNLSL